MSGVVCIHMIIDDDDGIDDTGGGGVVTLSIHYFSSYPLLYNIIVVQLQRPAQRFISPIENNQFGRWCCFVLQCNSLPRLGLIICVIVHFIKGLQLSPYYRSLMMIMGCV